MQISDANYTQYNNMEMNMVLLVQYKIDLIPIFVNISDDIDVHIVIEY